MFESTTAGAIVRVRGQAGRRRRRLVTSLGAAGALTALALAATSPAAAAPKVSVPLDSRCAAKHSVSCVIAPAARVRCSDKGCRIPVQVRAPGGAVVRVVVDGRSKRGLRVGAGKVLRTVSVPARSRRVVVRLDLTGIRRSLVTYRVPPTTRVVASGAVASVRPGPTTTKATVVLGRSVKRPVVGGHLALAPSSALPEGMFARVVRVRSLTGGRSEVVVARAALADVLDDVKIDVRGPVQPVLVDADGRPISSQNGDSTRLRLNASFARGARGNAIPRAFECKELGGTSRSQEDLWQSLAPFPVDVTLEHVKRLHHFDPGSFFPRRSPYMILQLSGEAVATVGFTAKTGFTCELSDTFRRNHRFRIPLPPIAGVPSSFYFEPTLKFEVSAAGEVSISQRHNFALTLEKSGDSPLSWRRAHSQDPAKFSTNAKVEASLFAGGDLSFMVGGGVGSIPLEAGLYGAFGPEFALGSESSRPTCLSAQARLRAQFGLRLDTWLSRWNFELASLTTALTSIGTPLCGLPRPAQGPVSAGGPPSPGSGGSGADPMPGVPEADVSAPPTAADLRGLRFRMTGGSAGTSHSAGSCPSNPGWRLDDLEILASPSSEWRVEGAPADPFAAVGASLFLTPMGARPALVVTHLVVVRPGGREIPISTFYAAQSSQDCVTSEEPLPVGASTELARGSSVSHLADPQQVGRIPGACLRIELARSGTGTFELTGTFGTQPELRPEFIRDTCSWSA